MRVHASGKVTFEAGDSLTFEVMMMMMKMMMTTTPADVDLSLQVQPGLPCYFAQEVACVSAEEQSLCVVGSVTKRIVCIPQFDGLSVPRPRPRPPLPGAAGATVTPGVGKGPS
jgi:hypothetical protein